MKDCDHEDFMDNRAKRIELAWIAIEGRKNRHRSNELSILRFVIVFLTLLLFVFTIILSMLV